MRDYSAALAEINTHIAAFGKPEALTLDDDTHIFHFERDGNWRDGNVILVNKNGNHFRAILQDNGTWLFAKTWNGLFTQEDWMVGANFARADPLELIRLSGSGPQKGPDELLCLLPKDAAMGRRKAVWRAHMLDVTFDRGTDRFTLSHPAIRIGQSFTGKLWESKDAALWAHRNLKDLDLPWADPERLNLTQQAAAAETAQMVAVLEENPVWGMF